MCLGNNDRLKLTNNTGSEIYFIVNVDPWLNKYLNLDG